MKGATVYVFLLGIAICFLISSVSAAIDVEDLPSDASFYLNHHYNASYEDPNPVSLRGKVVFITGITHGQGTEIARQYYLANVSLVIGFGSSSDTPPDIISQALYFRVDMNNETQIHEMVRSIYEDHNITKIDIFVGNAGRMYNGKSQDNTPFDYERLVKNNCEGNFEVFNTLDRYGMIDHQDHETVIMFTLSVARCSNLDDALGPYGSSKACLYDRVNRAVDTAFQNGWKETYRTLSPTGVLTNIGHYQWYPITPLDQQICPNATLALMAINSVNVDPYGPNPYDESTVVDIGKNYVMMARYRSQYDPQFNPSFKLGLYTHFVIKSDTKLDQKGLGDWDFWCPLFYTMNHEKFAQLTVDAGFPSYFPQCSATHPPHVNSPSSTPSASPKHKPKKSPKPKIVKRRG